MVKHRVALIGAAAAGLLAKYFIAPVLMLAASVKTVLDVPQTVEAALIKIKATASAFLSDIMLRVGSDMRPSADRQRVGLIKDMQDRSSLTCRTTLTA